MRVSCSILALLAASPAWAEDFLVRADIASAVVYATGAEVVRRAEIALPAGEHRLLFPVGEWASEAPPILAEIDGVGFGQVEVINDFELRDGVLDSAQQAAARAALNALEDDLETALGDLAAAEGAVEAAELQRDYLDAIIEGGEDGVAMPGGAPQLAEILTTLGAERARIAADLLQAGETLAEQEEVIEEIELEIERAERALADLQPFEDRVALWAVTLTSDSARDIEVGISEFANARWQPRYEVHLNSETGALRFERTIQMSAFGMLPWNEVEVTFSTSDPGRSREPSGAFPSRAVIHELAPQSRGFSSASESLTGVAEPMVEPVIIMEDTDPVLQVEGLSTRYDYPLPVTVGPGGHAFLPFGEIDISAELINRAVPRRDSTAFLIADFRNDAGEPILPGAARFFRDGALIGEGIVEFIPAGAETELPFGPLDHIQLSWTDLSRDSGDRGVFVSSNTEERRVQFSVENLSAEPVTVELLYPTPFSEQEDLEIEIVTDLDPAETSWEDRRGVYAWQLELEPGAEQMIRMAFGFRWPDGQVLDWRP